MYHAAQRDDKALAPLPFVASVTAMMDTRATAYSTVMIGISALYRWAASVVWETTKDANWLPDNPANAHALKASPCTVDTDFMPKCCSSSTGSVEHGIDGQDDADASRDGLGQTESRDGDAGGETFGEPQH